MLVAGGNASEEAWPLGDNTYESASLTPKQQEVKEKVMEIEAYRWLHPEIRKNLDFSKMQIMYEAPEGKNSTVFIPAGNEFGLTFSTVFGQPNNADDKKWLNYFGAKYKYLRPEYILPQYPQNEAYKKLSEKRFRLPKSAKEKLIPEQFEVVSTLMRIVKKDIDFLMNDPFYDVNLADFKAGKYIGKLYASPNRRLYKPGPYSYFYYFKQKESPLEYKLNNKLGRFLSLQEIAEFDKKLKCFGECSSSMNYITEGGHYVGGVRFPLVDGLHPSLYENKLFLLKREGLYETYKNFNNLITGLGEIIKEHGVDLENLPNIKDPEVPYYDKCLTYLHAGR